MSLCEVHWQSEVLKLKLSMSVILPDVGSGPFHTFYLLHGLSDDHTTWVRRTRIEWYVKDLPLIVVMPDGFRGWYTDNDAGPAYGRYIGEEVVRFVERNFPADARREARHIGGLSMGGYGALRAAFRYPDIFVSANSHSGALVHGSADWSLPEGREDLRAYSQEMRHVFGIRPEGSTHDILALARSAQVAGLVPRLLLDCGAEDFLLDANRRFHRELTHLDIPHEYHEYTGSHEWGYWDLHVQEAIRFHLAGASILLPSASEAVD
ncbi:MAG TPA: alpha/beta hydrolase family protein [Tepidisphaeraceae bacterium]|jgi:putative tributyrin esterase|nr:alpha/beta hydrolase family protein [Tepidisphaeraceae bacterium]